MIILQGAVWKVFFLILADVISSPGSGATFAFLPHSPISEPGHRTVKNLIQNSAVFLKTPGACVFLDNWIFASPFPRAGTG